MMRSGEKRMTDAQRIVHAAQFLCGEHRARQPFAPLPAPFTARHVEEAYAVQEAFHADMAATHGPVAGYKIALTTPVMQQMVGFQEPVCGAILARTIHPSPYTICSADHVHLGVECEVAVRLAVDLPAAQAPYRRDQVAAAIGAVMAAFELVDDRHADYAHFASQILSIIADNAWNAGIVLGPPAPDWQTVDLGAAHGTMLINGVIVGEGYGRDVMGHPLDALVWLTNMLAQRGKTLAQGMIVMTGSIVATQFVHPGDTVRFEVEGLGEVHCSVA
jgi:2-oxo-3-hexenedioate decarboxylase/2-keto-4-pentenoate hydratase